MQSIAAPIVLALPVFLALTLRIPGPVVEVGVPTPGYTLVPPLSSFLVYGYVFAIGWFIERQRALLQLLEQRAFPYLGLGSIATVASLATMHSSLTLDATYALALMSLTLAVIGLGMKFLNRQSHFLRYLADASYWMYIAHLPLVIALQEAVARLALHWSVKFVLVVGIATLLLLLSYHYFVRSTWIGHWLNGQRLPPTLVRNAS